ncbi:MAG: hypothetical protein WC252_06145, partial [Candidatus Cloacimonadaceae bacterium]
LCLHLSILFVVFQSLKAKSRAVDLCQIFFINGITVLGCQTLYKESPKFTNGDQWTNGDKCFYGVEIDKTIFRNMLAQVWTLLCVFGSPIIAN